MGGVVLGVYTQTPPMVEENTLEDASSFTMGDA